MCNVVKKIVFTLSFLGVVSLVQTVQATTVQFQTVMGDFEVNLYDKATPKTVANFLAYVQADAYKNTVIHRVVPSFVVQGGGFEYPNASPLVAIPQNATVMNEPVYANKRGTIAMAKLGGNENSATNQWFFNLIDNSKNLDKPNGGYTVFGEVTGNGMAIIDAMAALTLFDLDGAFSEFPLRNYTQTDFNNNVVITDTHLVLIQNIVVMNTSIDTAAGLTPVKNTANSVVVAPVENDSGGGNINFLGMLMLMVIARACKK